MRPGLRVDVDFFFATGFRVAARVHLAATVMRLHELLHQAVREAAREAG